MNDLHSNIRTKTVITPVAIGTTGTTSGIVIDRQGWGGVEFIFSYGSVTTTGTVVTVLCKEGDVTGTLTSVADSDLLGTETLASLPAATPRAAGTTKEVTKRLGYRGNSRYVTCNLTNTGVTSVGVMDCIAILHSPELAPATNP